MTDNNSLIFEEHQLCSSANLNSILQTIESGGLYVEDENKFIFCNVLVGHQAKARFKICNVGKIACDVNIVVKPISNKVGNPSPPDWTGPPWPWSTVVGVKLGREFLETPAVEPASLVGIFWLSASLEVM